jgi:hypothetical protein
MRKIVTIAAAVAALAVAAIVLPGSAEARFDAGVAAQTGSLTEPVYYYYRRRYYAPRYYAPRYYAPRYYRYY